jgi:hypothetical protein
MNISMPDEIVIKLPQILTIPQPYVFMLFWWIGIFLLTLFFKFTGKGPQLKEGIIAALSILIMYVGCVLIYKYKPIGLDDYLTPLPFLEFREDSLWLVVYEFNEKGKLCFPKLCSEIASLFLLAFLVNQIYFFKPGNLKTPGWLVFRFISTLFCIGVHYAVYKVLQKGIRMIPAGSVLETARPYFPIALLSVVLFLFALGLAKRMLQHFFKVVNPTFEGLAGFFFVNKFGVIVTRAIYSTAILSLFAYGLQNTCAKYSLPACVTLSALSSWGIGTLAALFVLWIMVGFLL